ncbi:MAG: SEC-C metal-binding domain-containing protein [Pyrinomonadaceae bacterium MAG19_C2-C3]|nr:SEC-C metal-binding domain-containing protein [Pyrinomonadaceae bacterium MAG19_C2-C3]
MDMIKVGRNELCPCGSGKKYKKCCGSPAQSEKPRPIFETKYPLTEPVRLNSPGLDGYRQSLLLQIYSPDPNDPRHTDHIEGEPGKYRVVITLHRPGVLPRPEGDYAVAEHLQGDSHLAIAKPAHLHPALPENTHVRLFTEVDDKNFMFICHPNEKGFLGKIELESVEAENFSNAVGKAYRGATLALSGMSFRYDVPLDIYQIDVIELRTGSVRISMVTPFRETPFLGDPTRILSREFLKYASYYRIEVVASFLVRQTITWSTIRFPVASNTSKTWCASYTTAKSQFQRTPSTWKRKASQTMRTGTQRSFM